MSKTLKNRRTLNGLINGMGSILCPTHLPEYPGGKSPLGGIGSDFDRSLQYLNNGILQRAREVEGKKKVSEGTQLSFESF